MMSIRTGFSAAIVLLALVGVTHSLRAQSPDTTLTTGTRIRVQSPVLGARPMTGNFVSLKADTLLFTREGETVPDRLALSQVTRVDVSAGRVKNSSGIEKRSLVPEIVGAALGAVIGSAAGSGSSRMKIGLAGAFGFGGYIAGRAYGRITAPATVEKWQPVTLRATRPTAPE